MSRNKTKNRKSKVRKKKKSGLGKLLLRLILLDMLLYYPFFKLMEKSKLAEEGAEA